MLNQIVPLWSPRFRQNDETYDLEYKPFPRYPTWLIAWNMSAIVEAIEYAAIAASEAGIAAINAQNDATAALVAAENAEVIAGNAFERRATMWHDESICSFGTPAYAINTAQRHNFYRFSNTQGNVFLNSFTMDLNDGATLYFLGATSNGSGQLEVYLDSTYVGLIEWYTAGNVFNVEKSIAIPAATFGAGHHQLRLQCVTKHASSSGYAIVLTKYFVIATAGD
jgi:hypothetical protein